MKFKITRISAILFLLFINLQIFGQATLIDENSIERKNGLLAFVYAPQGKVYFAVMQEFEKKNCVVSLIKLDEKFNLLWSKVIIENYEKGKASISDCFKLYAHDSDINLFYTKFENTAAFEIQIIFDLEGIAKSKENEILTAENCQLIKKIDAGIEDGIAFVPLKFQSDPSTPIYTAANEELSIFVYTFKNRSVKKIPTPLTDESITKFTIKEDNFYAHLLTKNTTQFILSLDLNTGVFKQTAKSTFSLTDMQDYAVNEMRTFVYSPDGIIKLKYHKPTVMELSDKEGKANAMGKIKFIKNTFDGKSSETIIEITQEVKEKAKVYGKNIGISKHALLQDFQVREAFQMKNKNLILVMERMYVIRKGTNENPYFMQMSGELLFVVVDENGTLLNMDLVERSAKAGYWGESLLFSVNQGDCVKLLYPAKKQIAKTGNGLHLTTISDTGEIKDKGKSDKLNTLSSDFSLDENSIILPNYETILVQKKSKNQLILYKVKL
ncbi:MAG: hypothetical protein M3Q58_00395 [Bacteroidota bacterium]|nr:hypothetical protein [Bacteroidota bacterium]